MLEFQLFRIKVYPSRQIDIFEEGKTRPEILKEIIKSLPEAELRRGKIWHIGNVSNIDESALYFRVGRIIKSILEVYEEGYFIDQDFDTAPYTHVILDCDLELIGLAKKSKLSPKTVGIARQLARLMNESERAQQLQAQIEIVSIDDPDDFVTHLRKAYSISKFWMTISRPNAFDVDKNFIVPYQKLLEASNGEKGKAEIKGKDLNPVSLEDLARSAIVTGDDATATLRLEESAIPIRKNLRGNPVVIRLDDIADEEQKKTLLEHLKQAYYRVRGIQDE